MSLRSRQPIPQGWQIIQSKFTQSTDGNSSTNLISKSQRRQLEAMRERRQSYWALAARKSDTTQGQAPPPPHGPPSATIFQIWIDKEETDWKQTHTPPSEPECRSLKASLIYLNQVQKHKKYMQIREEEEEGADPFLRTKTLAAAIFWTNVFIPTKFTWYGYVRWFFN